MGSVGFQFAIHSIHAFAKFLDVMIGLQESGNSWVAREMRIANVGRFHHSWKFARTLEHNAVVEHLDLDFRSLDVVSPVAAGIHGHFLYHELWIVAACNEFPGLTEESVFGHLGLKVFDSLFLLVEDGAFENHILDDIHFRSHSLFDAVVTDKTGSGAREEKLRILSKQQHTGRTDFFLAFLVGGEEMVVLL